MAEPESTTQQSANTLPRRILIVDDDSETRRLYRFLFVGGGFSVEEAEDGLTALRKLAEQHIPLVVTDMNMPQMDGLELIRAIRSDYPGTFLILVTAFGTREVEQLARSVGADDYLAKPFDFEELERRVHAFFQMPQPTSQFPRG
jgi:two-component system chemotaxis response regulator CheY